MAIGAVMAVVAYFRSGARQLCGGVIAGTLAVLLIYWLMVGAGLGVQLFF